MEPRCRWNSIAATRGPSGWSSSRATSSGGRDWKAPKTIRRPGRFYERNHGGQAGRGTAASAGFDRRNPFFDRGQRRQVCHRLLLVPESAGVKVVGAVVGVAVFHGVLQVAREGHGVVAVEAVAAVAAAGALRALDERRAILVMREWHGMLAPAEVPTPAEEILRAGAVDHRHGLVVDENHVVAFAPPILLVLHD